ncbi:MAG: hypothetical protein WA082_01095 [Candidatus Moraniibacteriota bacterium]
MSRFRLALGILLLSSGITTAIVTGISKPGSWGPLIGFIVMFVGSGHIAYAFPKKTS